MVVSRNVSFRSRPSTKYPLELRRRRHHPAMVHVGAAHPMIPDGQSVCASRFGRNWPIVDALPRLVR